MRPDNHDHVAAVLLGLGFDEAEFLDVAGQALQQPEPEFGPGLLASPEHDRHLDLVSLPEEPLDVALLGSPFLLYMDFDSGHGTGKTQQQRVIDRDYELRFLMNALG